MDVDTHGDDDKLSGACCLLCSRGVGNTRMSTTKIVSRTFWASSGNLSNMDQEYRRRFPLEHSCPFCVPTLVLRPAARHHVFVPLFFKEKLAFHTAIPSWSTKVSVPGWPPVGTRVAHVLGHFVISLDTMKWVFVLSRLLEETGSCCEITQLVTAHRSR